MQYKDYYAIMGVNRNASPEDIKRAYRKLARKYHPDVSKEPKAEERFKELGEAYELHGKDPQKRANYDQLGSDWQAGQEFNDHLIGNNKLSLLMISRVAIVANSAISFLHHLAAAVLPAVGEDGGSRTVNMRGEIFTVKFKST